MSFENNSEILIYQTEDGKTKIEVKMENETVWLSLNQMAELFQRDKSVISRHIKNVFSEGELKEKEVVAYFATTAADGKTYNVEYFNLDVIISVGYRVKSHRGTQFRIWATQRLKEYIIKGFTMNDDLLKKAGGGNYFEELLERIRDIRSSEKVFYRKILDIYATSIDYSPDAAISQQFFQTVQNKMHWAAHGHTAAEIVYQRVDSTKPFMGMTNFTGSKPTRSESQIAKNYLTEGELAVLNRIVNAYIEFAELQAMRRKPMYMADWVSKLDEFLKMSDREKTGVDTELAAVVLLEKYELIKELLHGHDYQKFFTGSASDRMSAIVETIDYIIGLREERKNEYIKLVSELSKAYSLCATTDIAEKLNLEVGFHKAVKSGIIKLISENSKKKTAAEIEAQLNQLISKSIASNEVIDVLDAVGLNKPNIAILSDEFLEEVRNMKQRNLAVELLNRLLKGKIKTFSRRNLVQSRKFSELLENAIRKYQNRTIETTQVIMELIELAKQINAAHKRGENTGLTEDELAFYDALAENESAKEVMGDDILKQIARDLTEAIRKNLSIDWSIRASVQAKMKMIIKRLLKHYGYPPDKTPKAVEIVMEQAKLMCQNESAGVRYQYQLIKEELPKVAEEKGNK